MSNGDVHTFTGFRSGQRLGPGAGAHAEIGDERRRHRVGGSVAATVLSGGALGPRPLLGALGKKAKASAFIVLADGTLRERKLSGNAEVGRAHREVVQFNAAIIRHQR